ncbi:MAG: hypothetical protein ABIH21_00005, partial [Patescibacteria group bacterium]
DMTGVETKPSGQTPKISNDGPVCAVAMATERDPEQVREQEKWRHESEEQDRIYMLVPGLVQVARALIPSFDVSHLASHVGNQPLPAISIAFTTAIYTLVGRVYEYNDTCEAEIQRSDEQTHTIENDGTWETLLSLVAVQFNWLAPMKEPDPETEYDYEYVEQVSFITNGFLPFDNGLTAWARPAALAVINNDSFLDAIMSWARPVLPMLVSDHERVKRWLRDYWKASHADLPALLQEIGNDDWYLYQSRSKLEGFFLRRWLDQGDGELGHFKILSLRYQMVRLAYQFGLEEAREWKEELIAELLPIYQTQNTDSYRGPLFRLAGTYAHELEELN